MDYNQGTHQMIKRNVYNQVTLKRNTHTQWLKMNAYNQWLMRNAYN